jgi:hypothetical protein
MKPKIAITMVLLAISLIVSNVVTTNYNKASCSRGNQLRDNQRFLLMDRVEVGKLGKKGAFSPGVRRYYTRELPKYQSRYDKIIKVDCDNDIKYFGVF